MGINDTSVKSLYLRLPCKIKEELQIKNLHPDIIRVRLARQKNARWCHIDFDSHEKCLNALKTLKKVKIEGKSVICKLPKNQADKKTDHKKKSVLSNSQIEIN